MPRNWLQHTINAELRYQLTQTALDMQQAEGSHERMILDEQYETISRFLDHPHYPGEFARLYLNDEIRMPSYEW